MVPELNGGSTRDDSPDSFECPNGLGYDASHPTAHDRKLFVPTKHISDRTSAQDLDAKAKAKANAQFLISSCAFCPPLKAIPLASYYKAHRRPLLSAAMAELSQDKVATIKLPPQDAIHVSEPEPVQEPQEKLPENGIHNKLLDQVVRTPGRIPSPQPTHLSVPGAGQHKILQEEGPGYVAPKFEGKELQMEQGTAQCYVHSN